MYISIYVSRYRSTFVSMKTILSAVKRLNKGESLKKRVSRYGQELGKT